MTTDYAQAVYLTARKEIEDHGHILTTTELALMKLGYSIADIARFEIKYRTDK